MGYRTSYLALLLLAAAAAAAAPRRRFAVANDTFVLDGHPIQIISGALHYFRIHPTYWRDRLVRSKALGLNAIELYVPWNWHEPYPGHYRWEGAADLDGFIRLAQELDLLVLARAGPYICAEFEFGGFPWWLGSSQVAGGGTMRLRSSDPVYLRHVDRWWAALFARLRPHLYAAGGPVIMMQVENEYGFCGSGKTYLRHLVATARAHLGADLLLYTTDPAAVAAAGTLPGDELLTTVDFGPAWFHPEDYFQVQRSLNAAGKSPPMCSEFYTGWLTHWGESMANTSAAALANDTAALLRFANGTGNLNFYMVHGGTNFGFWAGANVDPTAGYQPTITSYDYAAPISEAGDYCQPGIGGGCKFESVRAAVAAHTGVEPPTAPPRPEIRAYGRVSLQASEPLLGALPALAGPGVRSQLPAPMEEYGQRWGLILYRARVDSSAVGVGALLDVGAPVHDYAHVFVNGELAGRLERNGAANVTLVPLNDAAQIAAGSGEATLDILVHAMGRQNFGCAAAAAGGGAWDFKGMQSPGVKLNGQLVVDWKVFSIPLDDVSQVAHPERTTHARCLASAVPRPGMAAAGPAFHRGMLTIQGDSARLTTDAGNGTHLPDTYLDLRGWGKVVVWIRGVNLGWGWPSQGPQMTLYVPGPILREGDNEVVLLELEAPARSKPTVDFVAEPNFYGPGGKAASVAASPKPLQVP